ncbi:efflux transporter outer membrane subunit [uncultured Duncaniella sp.]|uniref:efflux transporter outer membrane subunit n=1 Tax=uncultured Duncaniella sp. TaxID=2768039 RepID=UPI0025E417EF|nr:efflux transporter outer membrane subunit [uncultured Duncaniella sp.]
MKFLPIIAILSLGLTGCNLYKNYSRPEGLPVEGLYDESTMAHADTLASLGTMPWESLFTDGHLQSLIREGLGSNTDMQIALLRIDEAKAGLTAAKLAYLPSLTFSPNGAITKAEGSKVSKTYEIPVAMSWEVDIFGKLRNAKQEAQALLLQQGAYARAVQSELIASIANSYFSLLMLDDQIEISNQTIEIWKEQVRTMELQLKVGDVRENAVSQAKANLNQLLATHNTLLRQQRETENSICTLLGTTYRSIERGKLDSQAMPSEISVGVPLQLLSARPDVVQAEMALAAAYYSTNQSRAAFYPSLTIGGSAGWTNALGQGVTNPGGWILSALGSLTQPIFQRGKLISNLRISKDEEQIAMLNYKQTLLNAGQEVNDALYAIESYGNNLEYHSVQCEALEKAVKSNELLFRTNNATYLELLSSRQDLLNSRLNLVVDKLNQLQSVVTLYKALGGGAE